MAKADLYELGRCTSEPTQNQRFNMHDLTAKKGIGLLQKSQSSSYSVPFTIQEDCWVFAYI